MSQNRTRGLVSALLALVLGGTFGSAAAVLPAEKAAAQLPQPFYAMVDLDGRGSLHIEDRVAVDLYQADDPIGVQCQQAGPSYGGSSIWDYTTSGYWVPDAYVYTGYSGYHPDVPRCMDTGHATEFPRTPPSAEGPFSAMVALDGRTRPVIDDPEAVYNAYLEGDTIYIKCQEYGPSYGGSTIWNYTTDGYWVPDAYVYTGYDSFHPETERCLPLGLSDPGNTTHGPYYAKVALDGRDRLSADANRIPDVYLSGDPIDIVCQERGPYYAGSDIWDYTAEGYWVPDRYVYTGSVTFVSGIPRCSGSPETSQYIEGFFRGGFGPYPAKYDLNGRHSPRADDWGPDDVDVYLAGDLISIQCQDYGETVSGSDLWIYTTDGYWVPDVYVYTGTSSFLPHVPSCSDSGVAGYDAPEGSHGPYRAKAALDGRSSINPEVVAVVDLYLAGERIYLECQDLGVQKYGSSIWGYTTDGYWVPDYYVKTGTDGFAPGVPRCSDIGIDGGDGVPTMDLGDASQVRHDIVAAARGEVGTVEGANNCNPYGFCSAWCTMFATWTWAQAGVDVVPSRVIGASPWYFSGSLYQWAQNNDRVRAFGQARPGDIVIYGDSPSRTYHTGVVEYVYSDGDIATIEGNLDNKVRRVNRFDPNQSSSYHPSGYNILAIVSPVNDEPIPDDWRDWGTGDVDDDTTCTAARSHEDVTYQLCLEFQTTGPATEYGAHTYDAVRATAVVKGQDSSFVDVSVTVESGTKTDEVQCVSRLVTTFETRRCSTLHRDVVDDFGYSARASAVFRINGDEQRELRARSLGLVGYKQETSTYCGPAAIKSGSASMGIAPIPSQDEIADMSDTGSLGTMPWEVASTLSAFTPTGVGYSFYDDYLVPDSGLELEQAFDKIRRGIDDGQPTIILVKPANLPWSSTNDPLIRHYIVLHGYSASGYDGEFPWLVEEFRVWDPGSGGMHTISWDELLVAANTAFFPDELSLIMPKDA